MVTLTKQSNRISYNVCEFTLDSTKDLKDLPCCAPGSTAFIIETSEVYMKNSKKEWVKI